MTRRGLFKLLAATPLAGIVAKFAPKPVPVYWRGTPYGPLTALQIDRFNKAYGEGARKYAEYIGKTLFYEQLATPQSSANIQS